MQNLGEPGQIKIGDLVTVDLDPDLTKNGHCSIVIDINYPSPVTTQNGGHITVDVLDNDGSAWTWFDWQLSVINTLD